MKYHITIKDNETGEAIKEIDACAIIGGIGEKDGANVIAFTHDCTNLNLAGTLVAANAAVEHVVNGCDPLMIELLKMLEEGRKNNEQ